MARRIDMNTKELAEYIIDYVHEEWVRRYPDEFYTTNINNKSTLVSYVDTTPKQELGDLYEACIEQAIEAYEGGAR